MRILVTLLTFLVFNSAFAQGAFERILEHVQLNGERSEISGDVFLSVKRLEPENRDVEHTADYFSLVHISDGLGGVVPQYVSVVSEDWSINTDNKWQIYQWIFQLSLDGKITGYSHTVLLQTMDRQVLDIKSLPATHSEAKQNLLNLLQNWRHWLEIR